MILTECVLKYEMTSSTKTSFENLCAQFRLPILIEEDSVSMH